VNGAQLHAWFEQNKTTVGVGGAAVVAGLAVMKHKNGAAAKDSAPAAAGDGTATTAGGIPYSVGGQTGGATGGSYDSTASDLYGALQPQLEAIGGTQGSLQSAIDALKGSQQSTTDQLAALIGRVNSAPIPVPAAPAPVYAPPPPPPPPPAPAPPPPAAATYTVRPGDSLSKIAARYPSPAITWQSIYAANRGVIGPNPGLIRPGQVLVIR
jgi:LysM repeat protein